MDERTVSAALSFLGAVKRLTNYSAGSQQTEFSTQGADLLFFSVFKKQFSNLMEGKAPCCMSEHSHARWSCQLAVFTLMCCLMKWLAVSRCGLLFHTHADILTILLFNPTIHCCCDPFVRFIILAALEKYCDPIGMNWRFRRELNLCLTSKSLVIKIYILKETWPTGHTTIKLWK